MPNQSWLCTNRSGLPLPRRKRLIVPPWKLQGSKRSAAPMFHSPTQSPTKLAASELPLEIILPREFRGPVFKVPAYQIDLAISIDVGRKELVVTGQTPPSRNIGDIAVRHLQSASGRTEHAEIGHAPVVAVKNEKIGFAVSVEIADVQLIVPRQAAPSRNISIVAGGHLEVRAGGLEHSDVGHAPIIAVKDEKIGLGIAAENLVVPGQAAPPRNVSVETPDKAEAGSVRAQHSNIGHGPVGSVEDEKILFAVPVEVANVEEVILGEAAPSRNVSVIAGHQAQAAAAVIRQQTEIRHHPVHAVEHHNLFL